MRPSSPLSRRGALAWLCLGLVLSCTAAPGSVNLVTNGGFEHGLGGWRSFWSRATGAGSVALESRDVHTGNKATRIEHRGEGDWSFEPNLQVPVQPGAIFELGVWIKLQGTGSATLCVSTWDAQDRNVAWSYGDRSIQERTNWTQVRSRFVIPAGVARIQPRLIGYGPCTVWMDDYSLTAQPDINSIGRKAMPSQLALTNNTLEVTVHTGDATFSVLDRRIGRRWDQKSLQPDLLITEAKANQDQIELDLLQVSTAMNLKALLELDRTRPEFTFTLSALGELATPLRFPQPFTTQPGDRLVIPMNEGISYPVEDKSIAPLRLVAYGGHGICMAFWGVTDDRQGQAVIIETPDDAAIQIQRIEGRLAVAPEWDSQKGQFGYARRLRYVFFDQGGHVAIAKRYREHARQTGLLKTLTEKRKENPNVDLLVGAVNIWNWEGNPVRTVKELQAAGIERILWSAGGSAEALRTLNDMKVLTSRYDIYQDMMDPANFSLLNGQHGDWTTDAWPKDIITREDGDWLRGWGIKGKNGQWYYCGVICDKRAPEYAAKRIPAELDSKPYRCRFIDTTTAAPWHECYHTNHPMTRTESRVWKMKLLDYVSREMKLVTGCETGHDAAVPFLHYFEGMLSLGPYRVPDAGRDMQRIWTEVPETVSRFQLGQAYRLPLWELVYHDCVVAQWYWGDYNNKLPSLWDKRDLFNLLYGTPPMFMFNRRLWESDKDRFVRSYQNTCSYVRAVGYVEMTDHRILTPDRNVQQSVFANGVTIVVNFGATEYRLPSGAAVNPMGYRVTGLPR
jgi:hypothetical protein